MVHRKGETPAPQSIEHLELACAMESLGSTGEQTKSAALDVSRYLLAVDKYVRDTFQLIQIKSNPVEASQVLDSFVKQAKNMHISLRTDAINSFESALSSLRNGKELRQAFDASLQNNGLVMQRNSGPGFSL